MGYFSPASVLQDCIQGPYAVVYVHLGTVQYQGDGTGTCCSRGRSGVMGDESGHETRHPEYSYSRYSFLDESTDTLPSEIDND